MDRYESVVTRILADILNLSARPLNVIEIGTAWGEHLHILYSCNNLHELLSIDPMYDWVPDIGPDVEFDALLVSNSKVDKWNENRAELNAKLMIMKSSDAARSGLIELGHFDILVIDGCHHPASAVSADYWDYVPFMRKEHCVIFDDINHSDPGIAADEVERMLIDAGSTVKRDDLAGGRVRALHVS